MKTKEEILEKNGFFVPEDNEYLKAIRGMILKAMEEYHQQPQKELSDEEIEKQYPITSSHQMDTDSWNNRLRQEGAKWYRKQIKIS